MPAFLEAVALVAGLGVLLVGAVPRPSWVARGATAVSLTCLACGALCAAAAGLLWSVGVWPAGAICLLAALALLCLAFWAAGPYEHPERPDADDPPGDGGSRRRGPPSSRPDPGGLAVDWRAFDTARASWDRDRAPA